MWVFLILIGSTLSGQFTYQEILFTPWGTSDNSSGRRSAPGGVFGPAAFSVTGDSIHILDSQNKSLKLFDSGQFQEKITLSDQYADDFLPAGPQHYYLLTNNTILEYFQVWRVIYQSQDYKNPLTGFITATDGRPGIVNNETAIAALEFPSRGSGAARITGELSAVETSRLNATEIKVIINGSDSFTVEEDGYFGTVRHLGTTPSGNFYIYMEKVIRQIPLLVEREVRLYTASGTRLASIEIPGHTYAQINHEFHVDGGGNFYHLLAAEDGIHVIAWYIDESLLPTADHFLYPENYQEYYHYNLENSTRHKIMHGHEPGPGIPLNPAPLPDITRGEALAIADTYVQHQWTAAAENLTDGRITDNNGVAIETPSWIRIGLNVKVPYKWGGFNTLDQFDAGLLEGKYAGDNATSGVSSACVGVDCSGFVSRCWTLPSHYSTRMMDDNITISYGDNNWSQIKPADAVHIPGHVRLAVNNNTNGTILTVEASGRDWRVSYRAYSYYDLSGYTPRYYINIIDDDTAIQPDLLSVRFSDETTVSWTMSVSSTLLGYNLQQLDNETWIDADNLIAAWQLTAADELIYDIPAFYRLNSVSNTNNISEPSDGYGYFNSGSTARILMVDGFDRISGSYNKSQHDFLVAIGKSLSGSGISFESASNDAVISGAIALENYPAVFWFLGDESTASQTFSDEEQDLVKNYLKAGGKFLVSGSEIAWDLDEKGSANDRAFLRDYFKVLMNSDDGGSHTISGNSSSVYAGYSFSFDDGTHGVYEEDYPDSYILQSGAQALLNYDNGEIAAAGFSGVVPGGVSPAAVVIIGFPVETVYNSAERADLLNLAVGYLGLTRDTTAPTTQSLVLHPSYPNPLKYNTIINFTLSQGRIIKMELFNILGQKVAVPFDQYFDSGYNEFIFYPHGLASGVYLYTLVSGELSESGKFTLIK